MRGSARCIKVFVVVSVLYAFFINLFMLHSYTQSVGILAPARLPPVSAPTESPSPCLAWTHAVLVMAPVDNFPRSNDPSEAIRALVPVHSMLKRLTRGTVYLAVSMATFSPSHAVWCERLQSDTHGRVSCKLIVADDATPAAALDALHREDRCVTAALTIENTAAVDKGLLGRVAAVATGNYACLSPIKYRGRCPVYLMPMNNNASFAFMMALDV